MADVQKQELKIVLLSDLHVGTYVDVRQLHKIVSAANQTHADLVVLAGDTFDQDAFEKCNLEAVKKELSALRLQGKIFAVLGNHDPASSNLEIRRFFKEAGIHLLIDECAEAEGFLIAGRDDILGNPDRKDLAEVFPSGAFHKPLLVIDHNPVGIDEAISQGTELVLCGHTHKGQFFPATLFTKWAYGERGFYGHFKTGNTHSIVSAGAGYFQMPMRWGTTSEIVLIRIKK